ncbi:MAG: hypothetical protein GY696_40275, partial [Gammaproteobacteria bacterium]|nr:hypothetical protein [Gammaproteobacteria bacterium]
MLRSLRKLMKMSRDAANASRMYDEQGNRRPEIRPNQLAGLSYHHFEKIVGRIGEFSFIRPMSRRTWVQGFASLLPSIDFRVDPVFDEETNTLREITAVVDLAFDWLSPGLKVKGIRNNFALGYYEVMLRVLGEGIDRAKIRRDMKKLKADLCPEQFLIPGQAMDRCDIAIRIMRAFIHNRRVVSEGNLDQVNSRQGPVNCTPSREPYTQTASYANMTPMHFEHSDWELRMGRSHFGYANVHRPKDSIGTVDDIVGEIHPLRLTVCHVGPNRYTSTSNYFCQQRARQMEYFPAGAIMGALRAPGHAMFRLEKVFRQLLKFPDCELAYDWYQLEESTSW